MNTDPDSEIDQNNWHPIKIASSLATEERYTAELMGYSNLKPNPNRESNPHPNPNSNSNYNALCSLHMLGAENLVNSKPISFDGDPDEVHLEV